ncbi:BQ2448_3186 [Microbotryum intermedium]|uniref:BQ2448_3186 protein n=1 Tax=Microbotryum intermedium TaxID=269621 RepID=A0A238FKA2_9BASI|nr:BQ2448_3186 [Microbotryum intermedium]
MTYERQEVEVEVGTPVAVMGEEPIEMDTPGRSPSPRQPEPVAEPEQPLLPEPQPQPLPESPHQVEPRPPDRVIDLPTPPTYPIVENTMIAPSLPVSPTTKRPPPPEPPTKDLEPPDTTTEPTSLDVILNAQPVIRKTSDGGLSFKRVQTPQLVEGVLEREAFEKEPMSESQAQTPVVVPPASRTGTETVVVVETAPHPSSMSTMDIDRAEQEAIQPKRSLRSGKAKANLKTKPTKAKAIPQVVQPPPLVPDPIQGITFLPTKSHNVEDIFDDDSGDEFEQVDMLKVETVERSKRLVDLDGEVEGKEVDADVELPKLKLKLGKEDKEIKLLTPGSANKGSSSGSGSVKQTKKDKAKEKESEKEKEKEKTEPTPKKRPHPDPSTAGPRTKKLASSSSSTSTPLANASASTPGPTTSSGGRTPLVGGGGGGQGTVNGRPLPSSSSAVDLSKVNKIKSSVFHPNAKKKPSTIVNPLAQFLAPKSTSAVAGTGKKVSASSTPVRGSKEVKQTSQYGSGYEPATEEKHKEMAEQRIREREERERTKGTGFNLLAQIDTMAAFELKYRHMYASRMNEARVVEDRPLPRPQALGAVFSYFPSPVEEGDEVVGAM